MLLKKFQFFGNTENFVASVTVFQLPEDNRKKFLKPTTGDTV